MLPASGPMSLNAVNVELGYSATAQISCDDLLVANLAGVGQGTKLPFNDFYSKALGNRPTQFSLTGDGTGSNEANAYDKGQQSNVDTITSGSVTAGTTSAPINATCIYWGFTGAIAKSGTLYVRASGSTIGSITTNTIVEGNITNLTGTPTASQVTGATTVIGGSTYALATYSIAITNQIPKDMVVYLTVSVPAGINSTAISIYDIVFIASD